MTPRKTPRTLELRALAERAQTRAYSLSLKAAGDDGVIEGYGSVFNVEDSYDDVIAPGAFAASLKAHLAAGTSTACFDGTNFFANSHTIGSGDNLDTFNGSANDGSTHKIIALRTDNPVYKPVLFQDRESLGTLETDADTPEARKKKMYEYWADCRFGLGYGYWWDAYHLTVTDIPTVGECYTIIEQIVNGMRTFTLPKGRDSDDLLHVHEGWDPTPDNFVLLCSLDIGMVLRRALKISQYVTATGNVDNVYQNVATVIPTSAL